MYALRDCCKHRAFHTPGAEREKDERNNVLPSSHERNRGKEIADPSRQTSETLPTVPLHDASDRSSEVCASFRYDDHEPNESDTQACEPSSSQENIRRK